MSDPDLSDDSKESPKPKREFIFYKERSLLYRLDGPLWLILHAWLVTYIDIREDGELEHFVPLVVMIVGQITLVMAFIYIR